MPGHDGAQRGPRQSLEYSAHVLPAVVTDPVTEHLDDIVVRRIGEFSRLMDTAILAAQHAIETGDVGMVKALGGLIDVAQKNFLLMSGKATAREERTTTFSKLTPEAQLAEALRLRAEIQHRLESEGGAIKRTVAGVIEGEVHTR